MVLVSDAFVIVYVSGVEPNSLPLTSGVGASQLMVTVPTGFSTIRMLLTGDGLSRPIIAEASTGMPEPKSFWQTTLHVC